ncbi:MAG: ribbon-helix-helix domain-containing protein [Patescibacteria group bacterium]
MIRTQVYFPDDLYRDIKLLAQMERVNTSQIIRAGADEYIKKKTKRKATDDAWKSFIGAGGKGKKVNGVRAIHDYYRHGVV